MLKTVKMQYLQLFYIRLYNGHDKLYLLKQLHIRGQTPKNILFFKLNASAVSYVVSVYWLYSHFLPPFFLSFICFETAFNKCINQARGTSAVSGLSGNKRRREQR